MLETKREDYGGDSVAHQKLWLNKAVCLALANELWTEVTSGSLPATKTRDGGNLVWRQQSHKAETFCAIESLHVKTSFLESYMDQQTFHET